MTGGWNPLHASAAVPVPLAASLATPSDAAK